MQYRYAFVGINLLALSIYVNIAGAYGVQERVSEISQGGGGKIQKLDKKYL